MLAVVVFNNKIETKMRKKYLGFFRIIILIPLIILIGCNRSTLFPKYDEISDSLLVTYQTGPEIHINGYIEAIVDNITSYCIVFPTNYGIRLFFEGTNGVEEIQDTTTYIGNRPNYLKPIGDIESGFYIVFSPNVSNFQISKPTEFFAEITGHLCDDNSVIIKKKIPFVMVP